MAGAVPTTPKITQWRGYRNKRGECDRGCGVIGPCRAGCCRPLGQQRTGLNDIISPRPVASRPLPSPLWEPFRLAPGFSRAVCRHPRALRWKSVSAPSRPQQSWLYAEDRGLYAEDRSARWRASATARVRRPGHLKSPKRSGGPPTIPLHRCASQPVPMLWPGLAQAGWNLLNVSRDQPPPAISVSVKDDAKRSS